MKLSDFPEVARLVPAKSEQQEMYYVGWNKAIDSLIPLLELELVVNKAKFITAISSVHSGNYGEAEKIYEAITSSNVIEIMSVEYHK